MIRQPQYRGPPVRNIVWLLRVTHARCMARDLDARRGLASRVRTRSRSAAAMVSDRPELDWYRDEADLRRGAPALNSSRASALRLLDDATPEPSTWAMMFISFIGLGYAGFRRARKSSLFA